jgi:hypothetical protein
MKSPCFVGLALVLGCAPSFQQVRPNQPHGVVHLRVSHSNPDLAYTDEAVFDAQPLLSFEKETSVRLSPGAHQLAVSSTGRSYVVATQDRMNAMGSCADPQCRVLAPKRESGMKLVEAGRWRCSRELQLEVQRGGDVVVLLIAEPGDRCKACVVSDRQATSCP